MKLPAAILDEIADVLEREAARLAETSDSTTQVVERDAGTLARIAGLVTEKRT